jgi:hypothetical protein
MTKNETFIIAPPIEPGLFDPAGPVSWDRMTNGGRVQDVETIYAPVAHGLSLF